MRVLIIGCGFVGRRLGSALRARGHYVIGTTTRRQQSESLEDVCDEIRVLKGSQTEKVHAASMNCDAIVVCTRPSADETMSESALRTAYDEALVETALNVASAPITGPLIVLSSTAIYGNAADASECINEESPVTDSRDAIPMAFRESESIYRDLVPSRHVIFRCSEIVDAGYPMELKTKMIHRFKRGKLPSQATARCYLVNQRDVVRAILFALNHGLRGTFNLTQTELPPTNGELYNAICDKEGLPHLNFADQVKTPRRPVSVQRLLDTGFQLEHSTPRSEAELTAAG